MIIEILLGITIGWIGILTLSVGVCIGLVWGDRRQIKHAIAEMETRDHIMKEALKQIQETHNKLTALNKMNDADIEDLKTKFTILNQGIAHTMKGGRP